MSGHAGAKRSLPGVGGGAPELSDHALLEIKPLGGGQEVGRSCLLLKYCGVTVLLDCGVLPSQNGHAALPFLDHLDPASIDVIVITHFHLDHCAALPYLTERLEGFKGRIFGACAERRLHSRACCARTVNSPRPLHPHPARAPVLCCPPARSHAPDDRRDEDDPAGLLPRVGDGERRGRRRRRAL